jgi:hypothetical protein
MEVAIFIAIYLEQYHTLSVPCAKNRIGSVKVSMPILRVVDLGFEPWSGETKLVFVASALSMQN